MGTSPLIYKYPLDLSGSNPTNKVVNEPHELPAGTNRAIVPNYGAFFSASVKVFDALGNELVPREQFVATQLYQEATQKTGLEVCTVIVVTDETIAPNVKIEYQAIGGEFSSSVQAVRSMIETLELDNREVSWGSVLGKPDYFPSAPHLHDAGDLYGFEYLVEALDGLKRAVLVGNDAAMIELTNRVNQLANSVLPKATMEEAISGYRDDVVLTPKTAKAAFRAWLLEDQYSELNEHLYQSNPHETTAEQVELDNLDGATPMDTIEAANTAESSIPPRETNAD